MRTWFRDLPVAWLQLSHGRAKLLAAVVGIVFADVLMWMQLGFRAAAIDSSLYIHDQLRGDLVVINPLTEQMAAAKLFPAPTTHAGFTPPRGRGCHSPLHRNVDLEGPLDRRQEVTLRLRHRALRPGHRSSRCY